MHIEIWPLSRITPYAKNAKQHNNPETIQKLARLIQQFGWQQPMVVDAQGVLVIGHRRLLAAHSLGLTEGPVHVAHDLNAEQIKLLRIADNRVHDDDPWDTTLLAEELGELQGLDLDLSLTGFDTDELGDLLHEDGSDLLAPRLYQIETVKLADLTPHPRNYRTHPPEQIAELKVSIQKHGQFRNLVLAEDSTILAGHGLALALAEMGRKTAKAQRMPYAPDSPQALKLLVGDNELGDRAKQDERILASVLTDLQEQDSLEGTGYDEIMLRDLVFLTSPAASHKDTAAREQHWAGMPEYTSENKMGEKQLIVHFETLQDFDNFAQLIGQQISPKAKFIWFPEQQKTDLAGFKYFSDGDGEQAQAQTSTESADQVVNEASPEAEPVEA